MRWGIALVLCSCLLLLSSGLNDTEHYSVDWFEVNHVYNDKGELVLDQVIMWEWVDVHDYDDKLKRFIKQRKAKVVAWYLLKREENREILTPEQQEQKNKELAQEWVKKYGIGADLKAPPYTPKFYGSIKVPHKSGKMYVVFITRGHRVIKITAISCNETWTQFDPEVDNRSIFPEDTRRNILKTPPPLWQRVIQKK